MKNIKCRVWYENEMIYSDAPCGEFDFSFDKDGELIFSVWNDELHTLTPEGDVTYSGWDVYTDDIMLYSCLKDNNGDNIYESDVVEIDTTGMNSRPETVKGIVKFIDGCFTVEFEKLVYENILKWNRERLYVKCFTVNHGIKIIGNEYYNPELMKT